MIDYGAINAKVMSMKGSLLTYEDFFSLSNFAKVEDFQVNLKQYSAYAKINTAEKSHSFLRERRMDLIDDFYKIIHFISDYNVKKYLKTVSSLYEAELIKKIIYYQMNSQSFALTAREEKFLIANNKSLNITAVLEAVNLNALVECFSETKFYNILKQTYDRGGAPLVYSIELERFCLREIEKSKKSNLSKKDQKVVNLLNGKIYDMQNIIRLVKQKKYYCSNALAYTHLIPFQYKLNETDIKNMSELKKLKEIIGYIEKHYYGRYIKYVDMPDKALYYALSDACKSMRGKNDISVILNYLFNKYYEIKNLSLIFEGIRHGLKRDDIIERLYGLWK